MPRQTRPIHPRQGMRVLRAAIAACVLSATAIAGEGAVGGIVPPTVKIVRQLRKAGTEGIELSCPKPTVPLTVTASLGPVTTPPPDCTVTEVANGKTKTQPVTQKKVAEAIEHFFSRYPKSRTVSADVAVDVPQDAVYRYEIVAKGRKAAGGYGFVDVNRPDVDKEAIFDAIVRLQREITGR